LTFVVENSKGNQIFKENYQEDISCKSTINNNCESNETAQQQLHFALERIFLKLMDDIQQNYKKW
jgi:hypothetical protein